MTLGFKYTTHDTIKSDLCTWRYTVMVKLSPQYHTGIKTSRAKFMAHVKRILNLKRSVSSAGSGCLFDKELIWAVPGPSLM